MCAALTLLSGGCADDAPPHGLVGDGAAALWVDAPDEGALLTTPRVIVAGRVEGIRAVEISVDDRPPSVVSAGPDGGWAMPLDLPPGPHGVRVRGVVATGAAPEVERTLYLGWSVPLEAAPERAPVALPVDARGLLDLLPDDALDATVARLDVASLFEAGLAGADAHPALDAWRQPLWRVDLSQTSLGPLSAAVSPFGLSQTRLLADLLEAAPEHPLLTDAALAEALAAGLWASHPAAEAPAGEVPVTLRDVLSELRPWADRYGPAEGHPGALADLRVQLLEPRFRVTLRLEPRGRSVPGLDRRGHLAQRFEADGPARVALSAPRREDVVGLLAWPRADFSLPLVVAGRAPQGGPMDPPPRGGSPVWALPPWSAERVAAEAAFLEFGGSGERDVTWDLGAMTDAVRVHWADGRLNAGVSAALGPAPVETWIWTVVVEGVCAALDCAEAPPPVRFERVPLPLSPETLADAVLAAVGQHAGVIAERLAPSAPGRSPAVLWLESGGARFDPSFPAFTDPQMRGPALFAAPAGAQTLYAQAEDGPVALQIEAGDPVMVRWIPLSVVP